MNNIEVLVTYIGDYLPTVIEKALARAKMKHAPVRFTFNEATVDVTEGDDAEGVEERIRQIWRNSAAAYRASPAGRAAAYDADHRLQAAQHKHDDLMATMADEFATEAGIIRWLTEMSDAGDHSGVSGKQFDRLADALEARGYVENAELGRPNDDYRDRAVLAHWLIGQAIDMLRKGLPPHPAMMERFGAQYIESLREDEVHTDG